MSRSGSTPIRNRTSISRFAHASRICRVERPPSDGSAPPRPLDLRAFGLVGHAATAGQERRVDPGAQGPAVAGATRHERHATAVLLGDGQRDVGGQRVLRQAFADQDHRVAAGLAQRGADPALERVRRSVPVVDPLQHVRLVLGEAERVFGDVPQTRPARMDHEDGGALARGLADPQVQDRHLLLGVQPRDEDHLRALDVPVGRPERRALAASSSACPPWQVRRWSRSLVPNPTRASLARA